MKFDNLYKELLTDANLIYPYYEYIDEGLLLENPDDFYNMSGSHCFLFQGDFYAADTDRDADGKITHGDMLQELEAYYINDDPTTIEMAFGGNISLELEDFFERSYSGEIPLNRDNFMNKLPYGIMGRISLPEKIISFWNPVGSFNETTIETTLWIIKNVYEQNPKQYKFEIAEDDEYFDSKLLSYDEFINLNSDQTPTLQKRTDHILHAVDPAFKGDIMKSRGMKPKKNLGAEMRFAMGESSLYTESINDKGKFKCLILAGSPYSGKSYVNNLIHSLVPSSRTINTDKFFEKHGDIGKAKINTINQTSLHINSLLPLIIDTTSGHPERLLFRIGALYQLGYDVAFCLVTAPWEDLEKRFNMRDRKVELSVVKSMYEKIYNVDKNGNISMNPIYESVVRRFFSHDNFFQYDNSFNSDQANNKKVLKQIENFFNSPIKNYEGQKIISHLHKNGGKYLTDTEKFNLKEIKDITSLWYKK